MIYFATTDNFIKFLNNLNVLKAQLQRLSRKTFNVVFNVLMMKSISLQRISMTSAEVYIFLKNGYQLPPKAALCTNTSGYTRVLKLYHDQSHV